jgi:hypothetical protein
MAPEMDHELTHSASDQSIHSEHLSHHRITNGYKICVHTCAKEGCISRKTNTILWCKEGHAVRKHANNAKMHPHCTEDCSGRPLLNKAKTSPAAGRDATDQEIAFYMGIEVEDDHPPTRCFNIIYIPDAAMRILSKEKAQNDLGFIPTLLHELEYEPLQHLAGNIHVLSKSKSRHSNVISLKIVMQEWVSVFL